MFTLPEMAPAPQSLGTDGAAPTLGADGTDDWHRPAPTTGTDDGTARSVPVAPALGTDGPDVAPLVPGTGLVPLLAAPQRTGFAGRLMLWMQVRITLIADYQRRHRTFWHAVTVFIARPPETWAETEEHLRSRKWLQEWMTGKFRVFCEWENVAWGHLVSMPAKAVLQNIEKVFFERQAGFWLGLAGVLAGFLAWYLSHLGH